MTYYYYVVEEPRFQLAKNCGFRLWNELLVEPYKFLYQNLNFGGGIRQLSCCDGVVCLRRGQAGSLDPGDKERTLLPELRPVSPLARSVRAMCEV